MVTTTNSPMSVRIAKAIEMLQPVLKYVTPEAGFECNHNLGLDRKPVRLAVITPRDLTCLPITHNVIITREGRIGLTYPNNTAKTIETQLIERPWEVEMDEERFLEGVEKLLREAEAKKREDADALGERADRINELRSTEKK